MKLFTISGGFLGLIFCFWGIRNLHFTYNSFINLINEIIKINGYLGYISGMFIAALTLLVAFKPNDPLPWHWLVLLMFSILLMIFVHIIAGFPVLVAGVMGLFNDA
jgi:hypothetical protein